MMCVFPLIITGSFCHSGLQLPLEMHQTTLCERFQPGNFLGIKAECGFRTPCAIRHVQILFPSDTVCVMHPGADEFKAVAQFRNGNSVVENVVSTQKVA